MIELVHMMRLFHLYIILRELVHNLGQITVHCREDGHTDREVRSPEECLPLFGTSLAHFITMILQPARRATHHLHALGPGFQIVTISHLRGCELNGYISRRKRWTVEVLLIVNIDDTYNLMSTVTGNLLYHLAHLSITD